MKDAYFKYKTDFGDISFQETEIKGSGAVDKMPFA